MRYHLTAYLANLNTYHGIIMKNRHLPQKKSWFNGINSFILIAAIMPILCYLLYLFLIQTTRSATLGPWCKNNFDVTTYNTNDAVANIVMVGEIHGSNEEKVANCLSHLTKPGDRLLIEYPDEGKAISCDRINSAYGKFNNKLTCFGFDVKIDDDRLAYADFSYRANAIFDNAKNFVDGVYSGEQAIIRIEQYAEALKEQSQKEYKGKENDPQFLARQAKYFKQLAKSLSGLRPAEIDDFLVKENQRLIERSKKYEAASRSGPTNAALISSMVSNRQLLAAQHRLFVVAGARHVDRVINADLNRFILERNPVTVLVPRPR